MADDKQPTRADYENAAKKIVQAAVKQLASNLTADRSKPVGAVVDGIEPLSADKVAFSWDSVPNQIFTGTRYTMSSQPIGTGIGPYRLPGPPIPTPPTPSRPTYKYSDDTPITMERLQQVGFVETHTDTWTLFGKDHHYQLQVNLLHGSWWLGLECSKQDTVMLPLNPPTDTGELQRLIDAIGINQPTDRTVLTAVNERLEQKLNRMLPKLPLPGQEAEKAL